MKYFLDSNIFLRFFADDQKGQHHLECAKLIKKIKNGDLKATSSHLVLAEVVWTLDSYYEASKDKVVKVLNTLESLNGLKITDNFLTIDANMFFKLKSVKYIDALIASNPEIQSKRMSVVSYDKDFDKLGVKRLEPKDLI